MTGAIRPACGKRGVAAVALLSAMLAAQTAHAESATPTGQPMGSTHSNKIPKMRSPSERKNERKM